MTEPFDMADPPSESELDDERNSERRTVSRGVPSNPVYARVGDAVLHAAQDGVRRGLTPEDIIREIVSEHNVRLNIGELRLLLASRRLPE